MPERTLCVYHKSCLDGFTAAWSLNQFVPGVEYHASDYNEAAPEIRPGDTVYILDFSYPSKVLEEIAAVANNVILLDHHATAINNLAKHWKLPLETSIDRFGKNRLRYRGELPGLANTYVDLDTYQSGAGLTYRHFSNTTPPIVNMVEDRDLWRFNLPGSAEYCRYVMAFDYTFNQYSAINEMDIAQCVKMGMVLKSDDMRKIEWIYENTLRYIDLGAYMEQLGIVPPVENLDILRHVPLVNVPKYMVSETLNVLSGNYPFVMGYYDSPDHRVFRFNSNVKTGIAINALAEALGGGGHENSAGVKVPRNHLLAKI